MTHPHLPLYAPTLLDLCGVPVNTASDSALLRWHRPQARTTDPHTSREAAVRVTPGNSDLVNAIRFVCLGAKPLTQFEIAQTVAMHHPNRWSEASIRSACARAGLIAVDSDGVSPRGSRCLRFVLGRL